MSTPPEPNPERKRPFALIVLAGLLLVKASLLLLVTFGGSLLVGTPLYGLLRMSPELGALIMGSPMSQAVLMALAALLALTAVGLIALRRTGWLLAMVLTGIFVAGDIYAYLNGVANHLWMALNILTVFYLNQADVRAVVGVANRHLDDEELTA